MTVSSSLIIYKDGAGLWLKKVKRTIVLVYFALSLGVRSSEVENVVQLNLLHRTLADTE